MESARDPNIFDQQAAELAGAGELVRRLGGGAPAAPSPPANLHICPECASGLVHPMEWAPVDARHWRVELRCPECEWRSVGLYEQTLLDSFDDVLDSGTDAMVAALKQLQRTNMEEEVERFNLALANDLILPEDF